MSVVADLLFRLRGKGLQVWLEEGRLCYASRRQAAAEDVDSLRASKDDIIAFLCSPEPAVRALAPRQSAAPVPLTFSQRWAWRAYNLDRNPSYRNWFWTAKISGEGAVEALQQTIAELVRRHEALRTRIVLVDGARCQEIDDGRDYKLQCVDLSALNPADLEARSRALLRECVWAPIDTTLDPLFVARLLQTGIDEYLLIVAADHLITDGASSAIFRREFLELFNLALCRKPLALPPIPIQFADYAAFQRQSSPAWEAAHAHYWRERLAGARRVLVFPPSDAPKRSSWPNSEAVHVTADPGVRAALESLSRRERTTLAVVILAAYAAAVMRWAGVTDLVLLMVAVARPSAAVENTIGFFAAPLFVRVELGETDRCLELLRRVREDYVLALEHLDCARVVMQTPQPEYAQNPALNWFPEGFHAAPETEILYPGPDGSERRVRLAPFPVQFTPPEEFATESDRELILSVFETRDELKVSFMYPAHRATSSTVEKLAHSFLRLLEALAVNPSVRVASVACSR